MGCDGVTECVFVQVFAKFVMSRENHPWGMLVISFSTTGSEDRGLVLSHTSPVVTL